MFYWYVFKFKEIQQVRLLLIYFLLSWLFICSLVSYFYVKKSTKNIIVEETSNKAKINFLYIFLFVFYLVFLKNILVFFFNLTHLARASIWRITLKQNYVLYKIVFGILGIVLTTIISQMKLPNYSFFGFLHFLLMFFGILVQKSDLIALLCCDTLGPVCIALCFWQFVNSNSDIIKQMSFNVDSLKVFVEFMSPIHSLFFEFVREIIVKNINHKFLFNEIILASLFIIGILWLIGFFVLIGKINNKSKFSLKFLFSICINNIIDFFKSILILSKLFLKVFKFVLKKILFFPINIFNKLLFTNNKKIQKNTKNKIQLFNLNNLSYYCIFLILIIALNVIESVFLRLEDSNKVFDFQNYAYKSVIFCNIFTFFLGFYSISLKNIRHYVENIFHVDNMKKLIIPYAILMLLLSYILYFSLKSVSLSLFIPAIITFAIKNTVKDVIFDNVVKELFITQNNEEQASKRFNLNMINKTGKIAGAYLSSIFITLNSLNEIIFCNVLFYFLSIVFIYIFKKLIPVLNDLELLENDDNEEEDDKEEDENDFDEYFDEEDRSDNAELLNSTINNSCVNEVI